MRFLTGLVGRFGTPADGATADILGRCGVTVDQKGEDTKAWKKEED